MTKTPRVSGQGEIVADALSKGSWEEAWPRMPEKKTDPEFIPITLRKWLNNPCPDMKLGDKILHEMSSYICPVHEWRLSMKYTVLPIPNIYQPLRIYQGVAWESKYG